MDPALLLSSEFEKNILDIEDVDGQVDNDVDLPKDSKFSDTVILIGKIALPILIAVVLFAAIPFVAEGAAIGFGVTGLFFIVLGVSSLLTGEGLVRFKAWGDARQVEADKANRK